MKLEKNTRKIKCEMGACKNNADYTIGLKRVGLKNSIHVCEACLKELYELTGALIIPKSVETAKEKRRKNGN
ncbi:MAG: hypothetical protein IJD07_02935 [Clostridia bacterium]|nr:hypothetical protein [Clostridia bacterium]